MNYLSRIFLPATALVVLSTASLSAADSIEIKQRWIVGKKYYQTAETTQSTEMNIGGQKIEQSVSTTMEMSQAIRPHEDGKSKRMTLRYDRVAMNMSMGGQKISFDSSKPGEGTDPLGLAKSMGSIAGKELNVLLNEKDEVTGLENYDEFIKNLGTSGVPGMDISKMFSKDSVAQMMNGTSLRAVPGHPVKPGDSWPFTSEVELPQLGKVAINGTYTLKGMVDCGGVSCAQIVTDGKMSLDFSGAVGKNSNPAFAALDMKVEGGSLTGTICFDPVLGFPRESQLTQTMTMTMKNPQDPSATLSIPIKQNISMKLSKVEDVK